MHLEQPAFTYSACETFTKNKERIQKFKETGDSKLCVFDILSKYAWVFTLIDKNYY